MLVSVRVLPLQRVGPSQLLVASVRHAGQSHLEILRGSRDIQIQTKLERNGENAKVSLIRPDLAENRPAKGASGFQVRLPWSGTGDSLLTGGCRLYIRFPLPCFEEPEPWSLF